MSSKSSSGFLAGLIVEGAVIGLVVTLLPKIPLGPSLAAFPGQAADRRPSLAPEQAREAFPPPVPNWRTQVSRPVAPPLPPAVKSPSELPEIQWPAADPAFVERRLDEAGQQLLSGVATYLSQQAEEVLQPPVEPQSAPWRSGPNRDAVPSFAPRANAFRY